MASPTRRLPPPHHIHPLPNTMAPTRHTLPIVSELAAATLWEFREALLVRLRWRRWLSLQLELRGTILGVGGGIMCQRAHVQT
jgi:hypothetical protein